MEMQREEFTAFGDRDLINEGGALLSRNDNGEFHALIVKPISDLPNRVLTGDTVFSLEDFQDMVGVTADDILQNGDAATKLDAEYALAYLITENVSLPDLQARPITGYHYAINASYGSVDEQAFIVSKRDCAATLSRNYGIQTEPEYAGIISVSDFSTKDMPYREGIHIVLNLDDDTFKEAVSRSDLNPQFCGFSSFDDMLTNGKLQVWVDHLDNTMCVSCHHKDKALVTTVGVPLEDHERETLLDYIKSFAERENVLEVPTGDGRAMAMAYKDKENEEPKYQYLENLDEKVKSKLEMFVVQADTTLIGRDENGEQVVRLLEAGDTFAVTDSGLLFEVNGKEPQQAISIPRPNIRAMLAAETIRQVDAAIYHMYTQQAQEKSKANVDHTKPEQYGCGGNRI